MELTEFKFMSYCNVSLANVKNFTFFLSFIFICPRNLDDEGVREVDFKLNLFLMNVDRKPFL